MKKSRTLHTATLLLRFVVMLLLIALLAHQVRWNDMLFRFGEMRWPWVLAGLFCLLLSTAITGKRWQLLLRSAGVEMNTGEVIGLTFLGDFISAALPGTVGGDIVKASRVACRTQRSAVAFGSILADRAIGLSACWLLAAIALGLSAVSGTVRGAAFRAPLVSLAMIAVSLGLAVILFREAPRIRQATFWSRILGPRIRWWLGEAYGGLAAMTAKPAGMTTALGLGIASQGFVILSVILLASGLQLTLPWHAVAVSIPLITILSAVPVTPAALGVMESLFILYFEPWAGPSDMLTLSLLYRVAAVVSVLPGAWMVLRLPRSAIFRKAEGEMIP